MIIMEEGIEDGASWAGGSRTTVGAVRAVIVWAAVVAVCVAPVMCDEFPPGCNNELEDFLDDDELWDNAFQYGTKGLFDEARICFEVFVASQPLNLKGWHLLSEIHARLGNAPGATRHAIVATRIGGENESVFLGEEGGQ